jgi:hypothetical protein
LPPPLAMRVCSVAHSSVAAELCVRRSVGLDALGFAAAWLMVRVVGILLGRWCRAAGGFIGEFVGPASLPGTGVRDRECAVAAAARRSSTWRARGFGLAASRARGKQWGELLKTGCSAAVQVRSEEIARLRLRRGRRGITASAIRPAPGKMRRGFCAVSCRVSLCAGYLLRPSAAPAFPAVSNSSAERDPAGRVPRLRRRRPGGPRVYNGRPWLKSSSVHVGSRRDAPNFTAHRNELLLNRHT